MISVIIPALNEENTIRQTMEQFRHLSLPHEVIVADGGSKDGTLKIAKELADKVTVNESGVKQTISKNRNNGAKLAEGEYLAFVDAGVSIPDINEFFKRALFHFEKNKKLIALTVGIYVFLESANFMDKLVFGIMTFNFTVFNNFLGIGMAQGKFMLIRREAFVKIGGFREDLPASEDMDLFSRLAKTGRTMIDPKLKVYHSGRRAHAIGWPKLLFTWWRDGLWLLLFNRIYSKSWEQAKEKK